MLNGSFRQGDKNFVKILNNLRIGTLDKSDREVLESRISVSDDGAIRPTILTTHNLKVEEINALELKKIPREEVVHVAEYFGEPSRIEFLKKNCLAAEMLKLKVGAQVMMIKNTYQKESFNKL